MAQAPTQTSGGPRLSEIPNLIEAVGLVEKKDAETAAAIQEQFRKLGENTAAQTAAARAGTVGPNLDTPEIIRFRDTEQLRADAIKSNAMAAAGFSADATSDIASIMLQDIRDTGLRMRAVTNKLATDKAVSLFEDPLLAIANAFTIPWTEQELQGLASEQANRIKTLNDLTSGVTNVAATAEATKAKINAAGVADRQRAIAEDLNAAALRIEAAGIGNGITALKFVWEADERRLTHVRMVTEYLNQQRVQQRADEQLALERKRFALAYQEAQQRIAERKEKEKHQKLVEAAEAEMFTLANATRVADGLPPYRSVEEIKLKLLQTGAVRAMLEMEVDRGRRLTNPRLVLTDSFGRTVEDRLNYLRFRGVEPQTPQERTFEKILLKAEDIRKAEGSKGSHEDADKYVREQVALMERYKIGDQTNPNAPIAYGLLAQEPNLSANPLFKKYILPTITDANKKLPAEPDQILATVTRAMIDNPREMTPAAATQLIKFIYDKSIELNNKQTQIYKWLRQAPTKLIAEVQVGVNPVANAAADITTITGAAMLASGAGVLPGALISGIGVAAEAAVLSKSRRLVDFTDPVQINAALVSKVSSELGWRFNTKPMLIEPGSEAYPAGRPPFDETKPPGQRWTGGYPPLLERNRILEGK